MKTQSDELN